MGKPAWLKKHNIEDILPLSPMQKGVFYESIKNPDSNQYFQQIRLDLTGTINMESFTQAWEFVVQINEVLRVVYAWKGIEKPAQIVLKQMPVSIKVENLADLALDIQRSHLEQIALQDRETKFDLETGPLFRIILCKLSESTHQLILTCHHILYDGWSSGIILGEFLNIYNKLENGQSITKPVKQPYKKYLLWLKEQDWKNKANFWRTYLADFEIKKLLPRDIESTDVSIDTATYSYTLSNELDVKLSDQSKKFQVTLASILYTIWGILLQKYSNNRDVVFGSTVSGRPTELLGITDMVGLFINTLPLRVTSTSEMTYSDLLRSTYRSIQDRLTHENTPLVEIRSSCGILPNQSLFESVVVIENYPLDQRLNLPENLLQINSYQTSEITNFDLVLGIELFQKIQLHINYNAAIFSTDIIRKIAVHFENVIQQILENPDILISQIELITPAEKKQILAFNPQSTTFEESRTLDQLFAKQVSMTPNQIALIYKDKKFTYKELDHRANILSMQIRQRLHGMKIKNQNQVCHRPVTFTGILLNRSPEMVIGILAALKAGTAYVPLDPTYPTKRIIYMLSDSEPAILLTTKTLLTDLTKEYNYSGEIISTDEFSIKIEGELKNATSSKSNRPEDLAYLIYTSGTTGKPKGVMIQHRSITNTLLWRCREYCLKTDDRVVQLFSFAFDGFVTSLFSPLLSGATSLLLDENEIRDPVAICKYLVQEKISHFICVPSLYNSILDVLREERLPALESITLAGERVKANLLEKSRVKLPQVEIMNEYGPTENSVATTMAKNISEDSVITIGYPIINTKVYILDLDFNVLPIGIPGQLCIAGDGLAVGYWRRPELNEKKFINLPIDSKQRIYLTGDRARWLSDGRIEFLGRIDDQVKIRGYRIETKEIENQLLNLEMIADVTVIGVEEQGKGSIRAYVVLEESYAKLSSFENQLTELIINIRQYLKGVLPDYMIPEYIKILDVLPLTPNGKIDRKALPKPEMARLSSVEYRPPEGKTEKELAIIWSNILGIKQIGTADNFFELGGHSLKATDLMLKILKKFSIELSIKQIFDYPTLKEMARLITEEDSSDKYTPIPRVGKNKDNIYPVSSAQRRLFLMDQMQGMGTTYNMPGSMLIEGELNVAKLKIAFQELMNRHESLRTSFVFLNGEPWQRITEDMFLPISVSECPGVTATQSRISAAIEEFVEPFDLSQFPLLRIGLIYDSDQQRHLLIFDMHHIISDGVSMDILVKEVIALYRGQLLPQNQIQYKDFAVWQNQKLSSKQMLDHEAYWLDLYQGEIPVLNLATDYPRPPILEPVGEEISFQLNGKLLHSLRDMAQHQGASLYMILLAVFNILLAKYTDLEDIIIGTPSAGRLHPDLANVIGMFVNTLPIRNQPKSSMSFMQFFQQVKDNTLQAFSHGEYQLEMLIEKLNLTRVLNRNLLFDVVFALQNTDNSAVSRTYLSEEDLEFIPYKYKRQEAKFDITLNGIETSDSIFFTLEYNTNLYKQQTMTKMAEHYMNILQEVVTKPRGLISEIEMLSADEKNYLLTQYNSTATPYPKEKPISKILEEIVAQYPEKVALRFQEIELTYYDFNHQVNQLAHMLRKRGVSRESLVGIMIQPSLEMLIGIFAILKAGGAYLPIDPDNPVNRISYILEDAGTEVLLTISDMVDPLEYSKEIICLDNPQLYQGDGTNLEIISQAQDLAYVMYTSGTTGQPKGNLTTHYNITSIVLMTDFIEVHSEDRVLQSSNYSFDGSTFNIFAALLNGATLVLVDKKTLLDSGKLVQLIKAERITKFFITTAFFNLLIEHHVEDLTGVEKILFGGEKASLKHGRKAIEYLGPGKVANVYGPTESTFITTSFPLQKIDPEWESIPIGKPLANREVYILNKDRQLQPQGVIGEVWIAGDGLSKGYLNRKNLTSERFIYHSLINKRLYRTGDLARILPDENIEFIARLDNQVKIRGFRVELAEIENVLRNHEEVENALVLPKSTEQGIHYLYAYIVVKSTDVLNRDLEIELRNFLAKDLPEYMIPAHFILLDKFPLTQNGKIDRRALPQPDEEISLSDRYIAPRNELEMTLAQIFSDVLGIEGIGIKHNFFDLGGHSLNASAIVSRVMKDLEVEISLRDIFLNPTIEEMSKIIRLKEQNLSREIHPIGSLDWSGDQPVYSLSYSQRQMFILSQMKGIGITYNLPVVMEIIGEYDFQRMEQAFEKLIIRHESLRTSFEFFDLAGEEDCVVQRIHSQVDFKLNRRRIDSGSFDSVERCLNQMIQKFVRPFDLKKAPLMRVELVEILERHFLLLDLHHIIADGASMKVLLKDFLLYYEDQNLAELRIQYKDFAHWQSKLFDSEKLKKDEEYWLSAFTDLEGNLDIPQYTLPQDFPRPEVMNFVGDRIRFVADCELTHKLRHLAVNKGTTLYIVLLTAYNILLSIYADAEDIVVGMPIGGRLNYDLEKVIGMFVNTLPIRSYPDKSKTIAEFLEEVMERSVEAYDHQNYQLAMLIDLLGLSWNLSQNPLFDTVFTLEKRDNDLNSLSSLKLKSHEFILQIAKFDLTLNVTEFSDTLTIFFEYRTSLFKRETIQAIGEDYLKILSILVEDETRKLSRILDSGYQKIEKTMEDTDFHF